MGNIKKLLLLTEVFPPAFNPRMGYLVKYLKEYGWEVVVITENIAKEGNFGYLSNIENIKRVDLKNTSSPKGIFQKTWRLLNKYRHFRNNKKPFTKAVLNDYASTDFSLVMVSVSWNLFVLEAGYEISKKWNLPFVVDLRDIIEQKALKLQFKTNFIINRIETDFQSKILKLRNNINSSANHIFSVSTFHVDILKKYNPKVSLIFNGYDDKLFVQNRKATEKFRIIYTGIILSEKEHNSTLFFHALYKLLNENKILKDYLEVLFYTSTQYRQPIYCNNYYQLIDKNIEFHDYLDYEDIPELLNNASIGLVLTNDSKHNGPNGGFPTKFFEYLGSEIPVLCVKSDESLLEKCINDTGIGCSARTVDEAYNFILEKWLEWKEKGYTTVNVNQEAKSKFTRRYQAKQFIAIFENTLNNQSR